MSTSAQTLLTDDLREQMEADYRHLHANPELSMQEHETAAYVERRFDELGVEHFRCGGTGVVGIIRNGDGPVVAYRGDSDGLPILEHTGFEWASKATGTLDGAEVPVMHGCGHDIHTSNLMGVARVFAENRDNWKGTLVLLSQPGEETAAGAAAMVADGLWEKAPKAEVVYGQHVMPGITGTVNLSIGTAMSMADALKVTLHGRQAHGSQPQNSIDPIVLGSHIVTRLQSVVSRNVDPRDMAVVTVGTFHSGTKENIIPGTAELGLNVRTFDTAVRETVLDGIRRTVEGEVLASGAPEAEIEELYRFPANYNDPTESEKVLEVLRAELGEENVEVTAPLSGSEDFGALAQAIGVPSVFWLNGGYTREFLESGAPIPGNHHPQFGPVPQPTLDTGLRTAVAVLMSRLGA